MGYKNFFRYSTSFCIIINNMVSKFTTRPNIEDLHSFGTWIMHQPYVKKTTLSYLSDYKWMQVDGYILGMSDYNSVSRITRATIREDNRPSTSGSTVAERPGSTGSNSWTTFGTFTPCRKIVMQVNMCGSSTSFLIKEICT